MNRYELKMQNRRLAERQAEFIQGLRALMEVVNSLKERLSSFQQNLKASQDARDKRDEAAEAEHQMAREVLRGLESIGNAFDASNLTINQNSERLEKLTSRFESYFGGANLHHDS